jgi:Spy/CpxP family protein refolding chaperone
MSRCLSLILVITAVLSALWGSQSSSYQPATITGVTLHPNAPGEPGIARYDVTLKVGNNVYVVLYTPPQGQNTVEYAAGMDILVLVENDSIRFSKLGTTGEAPIQRREALPIENTIDWSKAPGQYFSMKMQNLTQRLSLTEDQRAKIKPIAEQEASELGYLWGNPVMSDTDKLKQLEKVVRSSDAKLKPILSPEQLSKLEQMRAEQKQELDTLIANRKSEKQ